MPADDVCPHALPKYKVQFVENGRLCAEVMLCFWCAWVLREVSGRLMVAEVNDARPETRPAG